MTVTRTADRPVLGMMLMLGFCILAPMGDGIAKILGATIPLWQLLIVRFGIQALVLVPVAGFSGRSMRTTRRVGLLVATRTLLHLAGVGAMFLSLRYLPLADAVAIAFVMPFIMLLLGRFVLNEQVGWHRLTACAVGFVGTLLVIQPAFAAVGAPALLPLFVAVDFALFMLVTRQVAKDIDPVGMQALSGLMAVAFLLVALVPVALLADWRALAVVPELPEAGLLLAIGLLGTLAHLLMTWSLRFAPSATLAPMQYLEIPVATLFGFIIFGDLPNRLAATGIAITIAAGLYVVYREHAAGKVLS